MKRQGHFQIIDTIKELASYSHLGITFAVVIIVFLLGGQYLDKKLGTDPFLTLIGAFVGGGTGFYYVVRGLNRRRDDTEKNEKKR